MSKPVNEQRISALMINGLFTYNIPGGDLSDRFGNFSALGAGAHYKTPSNWIFSYEYTALFGFNVIENDILREVAAKEQKLLINDQGLFEDMDYHLRGIKTSLLAGKILPLFGPNENSGILLQIGGCFLQHRIFFHYPSIDPPPQIRGEYMKGYDRLTNGFGLVQKLGYFYMHNNNSFNFFIGVEMTQAFTQNRRAWNFDTMEKDDRQRTDLITGIQASIFFPLYRGVSDDDFFN